MLKFLGIIPLPRSTQGKSFYRLCARFGAVIIIVDFYIDDFIFALFIFMKDGKAVNYNGSEIIGLRPLYGFLYADVYKYVWVWYEDGLMTFYTSN